MIIQGSKLLLVSLDFDQNLDQSERGRGKGALDLRRMKREGSPKAWFM